MVVTKKYLNELTYRVIGCAIEVHKHLGPGLLESVYELALMIELDENGIPARRQVEVPVFYRGRELGTGFRADIIVADSLLLEIKAIKRGDRWAVASYRSGISP